MTPFYITQFSHMPLVEGDDDHDHEAHLHPFTTLPITTSYSDHHLSSLSYPILFNPPLQLHEGASNNIGHHQIQPHHQLEFIDQLLIQGSSNFPAVTFPNCTNTTSVNNSNQYSASTCDQYMNGQGEEEDDHHQCKSPAAAGKWMSSKMRIMRKMMNPDGIVTKKPRRRSSKQAAVLLQDQLRSTQPSNNSNSNNNSTTSSNGIIIRVCSDCNTTKTPLWRSGPSGPKSLCNACGIRQRKARRALAAAAAVSSGLIPAAAASAAVELTSKEKNSDPLDRTIPFKKRCRFHSTTGSSTTSTAQNRKMKKNRNKQQLGFDDIVIRLSKSSAFHQVFPQDEKDAAILLMALSCGVMCS